MKKIPKNIFTLFEGDKNKYRKNLWMILGKGPTFSKTSSADLSVYNVFTLNDAVREYSEVDIAHFIDFDAFERCSDAIEENAKFILLPWFPHFKNKAGKLSICKLAETNAVISSLIKQGRLLWYDLSSSKVRHGLYPTIHAQFFSAEAALSILAEAGVKSIRSLGVDGGTNYSCEFSDLEKISLLSNKHSKFDRQFESFSEIISRTGVDYSPFDQSTPIKVFIAATTSEELPARVLAYSIKRHCSVSIDIVNLNNVDIHIPIPQLAANRARTPFSFQRFLIPELCDYQGHAIYLDSDMLVFSDIRKLWSHPFSHSNVLCSYSDTESRKKPQFSVMLLNCNDLTWKISNIITGLDSGNFSYKELMHDFVLGKTKATIDPEWNSLEKYNAKSTNLLHYTNMHLQPWVSNANPLSYLWVKELHRAVKDGDISCEFIDEEIKKGHIRPSLSYQIKHNIHDPLLLPKEAVILDSKFTAPYKDILKKNTNKSRYILQKTRAVIRLIYHKIMALKYFNRILSALFRVIKKRI